MKAGRKPKPTSPHLLHGKAKNRRSAIKREPKPTKVVKIPYAPRYLNGKAKKAWGKFALILTKSGILSDTDLGAFEVLCITYAEMRATEALLDKGGAFSNRGTKDEPDWQESIFAKKAERLRGLWYRYCVEFGMTPSSRTRIEAVGSAAGINPYADWKNGR